MPIFLLHSSQSLNLLDMAAVIVSVAAFGVAWYANRYSRDASTASTLLSIYSVYTSDEMTNAILFLRRLQEEHRSEIKENAYRFARSYLTQHSDESDASKNIRRVSLYYSHLAALVDSRLVEPKAVYSRWSSFDDRMIELLEPFETIRREEYDDLSQHPEWAPLRLRYNANKMALKIRRKPSFTLPHGPDLYHRSKDGEHKQ